MEGVRREEVGKVQWRWGRGEGGGMRGIRGGSWYSGEGACEGTGGGRVGRERGKGGG